MSGFSSPLRAAMVKPVKQERRNAATDLVVEHARSTFALVGTELQFTKNACAGTLNPDRIPIILPTTPRKLLLNKSGTTLAFVCDEDVYILSTSSVKRWNSELLTPQKLVLPSSGRIISAAFHPLFSSGSYLAVLLSNSIVYLFNADKPAQPAECMYDVALPEDCGDLVSMSFGMSDDGWSGLTLYLLSSTGHVFLLCPVLPLSSSIPLSTLKSLSEGAQGSSAFPPGILRDHVSRASHFVNMLLECERSRGTPATSFVSSATYTSLLKFPPALQGPLELEGTPPSAPSPASSLLVLPFLYDRDALIVSFIDSLVHVCVNLDGTSPRWRPSTLDELDHLLGRPLGSTSSPLRSSGRFAVPTDVDDDPDVAIRTPSRATASHVTTLTLHVIEAIQLDLAEEPLSGPMHLRGDGSVSHAFIAWRGGNAWRVRLPWVADPSKLDGLGDYYDDDDDESPVKAICEPLFPPVDDDSVVVGAAVVPRDEIGNAVSLVLTERVVNNETFTTWKQEEFRPDILDDIILPVVASGAGELALSSSFSRSTASSSKDEAWQKTAAAMRAIPMAPLRPTASGYGQQGGLAEDALVDEYAKALVEKFAPAVARLADMNAIYSSQVMLNAEKNAEMMEKVEEKLGALAESQQRMAKWIETVQKQHGALKERLDLFLQMVMEVYYDQLSDAERAFHADVKKKRQQAAMMLKHVEVLSKKMKEVTREAAKLKPTQEVPEMYKDQVASMNASFSSLVVADTELKSRVTTMTKDLDVRGAASNE